MNKEHTMRVSIPGKIYDLIWNDEEFFRDISSNKKASSANKFPRYDQWCTDDGLHMAFALAGYSASDIKISVINNEISVSSVSDSQEPETDMEIDETIVVPERKALPSVNYGIIIRGIARRSFKTKFVLHQIFDTSMTMASMKNGLLEIVIPKINQENIIKTIEVKEK